MVVRQTGLQRDAKIAYKHQSIFGSNNSPLNMPAIVNISCPPGFTILGIWNRQCALAMRLSGSSDSVTQPSQLTLIKVYYCPHSNGATTYVFKHELQLLTFRKVKILAFFVTSLQPDWPGIRNLHTRLASQLVLST
jgi:hypothetical protein